ncbi:helix-turn-helix domain-containing protein [Actinokineospora cianjurensis]|uniref:NACHT domain-containing protein n=1 Tax=Actinokineospora cianjurensis TaxID=585224 RepID=A0A421AWY7_9PSEU|nr:helix-turn-helix domain-containing protein [Actinokineospora cianjurensis]RLK54345.1 NACHT domain-containing protein [Actinokineospora cianjurensis]
MAGEFGRLVRALRRAAGLTQEELARRAGISDRTVRRLESADPGDTRIGTVKLVADALDLGPEDRRTLMAAASSEVPATPEAAPDPETSPDPEAAPDPEMSPDPVVSLDFGTRSDAAEPPARRDWPVQAGLPADDGLSDAVRRLAHIVHTRWEREEGQRGVHDPFPLPVRWHPVAAELADRWDNVRRLPPGEEALPIDLTGTLPDIATIYRMVPSRRLVVLGEAGSGKSVLAIRFTLDYLRTRAATEPVPVIFSLGGWDPATPLREWLVDRLLRDDPGLLAPAPTGPTLAAALVEAGWVLPVLDGFDELPAGLRAAALAACDETSLPMLLTSRPEEYAAVGRVLNWSAGVELDDLDPGDLADYLPRATRHDPSWDRLVADMPAPLTEALRTPLMVALARTTYRADPAALTDPALDTRAVVEEHLLAGYVPSVYRDNRRWPLPRVRHWLGGLAEMSPVEVAWWRLGDALSRSTRVLAVVIATSLVTAVCDIAVSAPFILANGLGPVTVLLDGLLIGPVVGLGFGVIYGLMIVYLDVSVGPSRVRLRLGNRVRVRPTVPTRVLAGFVGGFVVGLGYGPVGVLLRGMAGGFPTPAETIRLATINALALGFVFAVAVAVALGLVAFLESPHDLTSATGPLTILAANRTAAIHLFLVLTPLLALAIFASGFLMVVVLSGVLGELRWSGHDAFVLSTIGGLSGAASYVLTFTAWGQWIVFTRVCLPLLGRLPWSVTDFLTDAHTRGVLRQSGAVYQFRHARLRSHLTR